MKVTNPIDKLITEWSWRCEKGYPDLKNSKDMAVLKQILLKYNITSEQIEKTIEEQEQQQEEISINSLIQLLKNKEDVLDSKFIKQIYIQVENKGKKLTTKLIGILEKKGIITAKETVIGVAERLGIEGDLVNFLENKKKITLADLRSNSGKNFRQYLTEFTKLPENFISSVISDKTPIESKGVGEGEYALALFGEEGAKRGVGDVNIEGKSIEVKSDSGRLGERFGDLTKLYTKMEETFNITPTSRGRGSENLITYISSITSSFKDKDSIEKLKDILDEEFDGYFSKTDITNTDEVRKALFSWYVDMFYKTEPSDLILIILKGKFKIYTKEEFKQDVLDQKVKFKSVFSSSNKSPQLVDFE